MKSTFASRSAPMWTVQAKEAGPPVSLEWRTIPGALACSSGQDVVSENRLGFAVDVHERTVRARAGIRVFGIVGVGERGLGRGDVQFRGGHRPSTLPGNPGT